jgi:hypothetical protein
MKLIYTFTVEINVDSLDNYQDSTDQSGAAITTIQQAAALEEQWCKDGTSDSMDILNMADGKNFTVTVVGVE